MARRYESLATAADRTGVSVKTLRKWIAAGALPGFRHGRMLRVDPDDIDELFRPVNAIAVRRSGLRIAASSGR